MASRKYAILLALAGLIATASFAQKTDAGYGWVLDSSKRTVKNMPQQNEFMNNQYPYPSKPRSMWELGVSGGASFILGDLDPKIGYGGGLSARKALGHVFSLRAGWSGSFNYGLDYRLRSTAQPGQWQNAYTSAGKKYVPNYKASVHQLSLDVLASLNSISHYRGNPKNDFYVLVGYSVVSADVDVDALDANNRPYNFETATNYNGKRADIKSDLNDLLDGDYESNGPASNGSRDPVGRADDNQLIRHSMNMGAGFAFKVSDKFNIGIEQRFTVPFDDNFDGIKDGKSNDILSATQFRLNFNIGSTTKNIQPLWWVNPNNYVYNEVNAPKHMKLPPVVLPDADGDGVTDQFDQEANTPAGSPVDSHGVSRDTDGDGVPDSRDKEPLTARDCFPVDADGVGKCPEPPCCVELRNRPVAPVCALGSLPSAQFKSGSLTVSPTTQSILNSVAEQLKANPACNVKVTGYYKSSDKRSQQLSWDRVNTVVKYLVEQQGIAESRLIFNLSPGGDPNTVDMIGTTEAGPNTIQAPFPQYQKSK